MDTFWPRCDNLPMKYTTDHEKIREWIEDRGGRPASVKGLVEENGVEAPEMLHISFGAPDPNMEELAWEEFFERFEDANLALTYEEKAEKGEAPNFEFVDRDATRGEFYPETEMPDTGDEDELTENIVPDSDDR